VVLPDTCLARIMACLAGSMDLAGLRGPSAVAKDLGAAALVSSFLQFYQVKLKGTCVWAWSSTNDVSLLKS
jgi:hypothetical protein